MSMGANRMRTAYAFSLELWSQTGFQTCFQQDHASQPAQAVFTK